MRIMVLAVACGVSLLAGISGAHASPRPPAKAELVYVPVQPCRAFDTRATTPIGANQTRGFHIAGSSQFPEQGGAAHGCGVPSYATAVSVALTALNESAAGYLTAFGYNTTRPTVTSLYYQPNTTLTNTVIVGVNAGNISIFSNKQTDVAGDVTGYYAQQIEGMVAPDGSIYAGSTGLVSAVVVSPGVFRVTLDRDVTYCTPMASVYSGRGVYGSARGFAGTDVFVYTWNIDASTHLEVGISYFFYLSVQC